MQESTLHCGHFYINLLKCANEEKKIKYEQESALYSPVSSILHWVEYKVILFSVCIKQFGTNFGA